MSLETLVQHLGAVEDPRCEGKVEHRLLDTLLIAVCAVIACAESWCDIALYGRSKLAWLSRFSAPLRGTVRPMAGAQGYDRCRLSARRVLPSP